MAQYGLQIWNGDGVEIFNSSKGNARYLGSFIPDAASGSRVVSSMDNQPIVNLFAHTKSTAINFLYQVLDNNQFTYTSVWVEGNTIHWTGLATVEASRIYYGDSYA